MGDHYGPNQDRQMIVVAAAEEVPSLRGIFGESFEEADYDFMTSAASREDRLALAESFMTGNIFALGLAGDVAIRRDSELQGSTALLVNFSMPQSMDHYQYLLFRRAAAETRVHTFYSPSADSKLAVPLLKALQEAGHDIPTELAEAWSKEGS